MMITQLIGILAILYLASLVGAARYLRQTHAEVWNSLGQPSLLNWSINSSIKLGGYVFFKSAYRELHDAKLTGAIYALRALALVIIGLIILWKFSL
jgi:hypothetical protein